MCQPKPGRRCASHTKEAVNVLRERVAVHYQEAEEAWKANPDNARSVYTVARGLAANPALEYALRETEEDLAAAKDAYAATRTGLAENRAMIQSILNDPDATPKRKNEMRDLLTQIQRVERINGRRDSVTRQLNAFNEAGIDTSHIVKDTLARQDSGNAYATQEEYLDYLQLSKDESDVRLAASKERVKEAVEELENEIVYGDSDDQTELIEDWKSGTERLAWAQAESDTVNQLFNQERAKYRTNRVQEKRAAFTGVN